MKIVLYKDKKGEYRWRLVSKNGKILADCAEGYKEKRKMIRTVAKIVLDVGLSDTGLDVVDKTGKK